MPSSISDMMDLSNPFWQRFSLPKPLICYIFQSSKLIPSQKLMKCCKTFKLLHLEFGESQVKKLLIFQKSHIFDIGFSCIKFGSCELDFTAGASPISPAINFEVKTIKVLDEILMNYFNEEKFTMLIPKLNLSLTKQIILTLKFQIKQNLMEMLLNAGLEVINMWLDPQIHYNPTVIAFQRCPNLIDINMAYVVEENGEEVITKEDLKEILKTKRNKKIQDGSFMKVSKFCPIDLIKFMDHHVGENGKFYFTFQLGHFENYLNLKTHIENVAQERRKKGIIPKSHICLECGTNEWYKQKL